MKKWEFIAALLVVMCSNVMAAECRIIEYAELKDMSTQELLQKGSTYYFGNDLNKQFLPSYEAMASTSIRERLVLKARQEEVITCNNEISKIVEQINRRKDLKRVLAKKQYLGFKGEEFLEEYSLK